ncbi:peptidoglycan -binding protein [Methyloligella sp. 2.7D]|uniref:peptidoglycan -binding protein n=1 Tax=unclassified Methyloligella TaxID=2625955 RepID=UPI00157CFE7B|nr:peptidoglycan -binding protein [Methyloligella sp. GL2]QKP76816.1 peptidoglycan -binding protein [Methyloligella sp. GL2]
MALARSRRRPPGGDYWPGFVDMLSTLLLVVIFLLSMFMLANYFITQQASGKDTLLARLNTQLSQLTELLALERSKKQSLEDSLAALQATLADKTAENARLSALLEDQGKETEGAEARASSLTKQLAEQKGITNDALAKVEVLNQQLAALRQQLASLQEALEASEARDRESQVKIADLGKRLNLALARKVQELARYRSDFFGRLREILGNREDIRVVGDRFVFQAEVLFDSGSAALKPSAEPQLDKLSSALKQLEGEIPEDIPWVLRVDGHTDINPIATPEFASNWELSSERAISVVKYLIRDGVKPSRLVAAGFGEYQPLDPGLNTEAFRKNRRIELKLTER